MDEKTVKRIIQEILSEMGREGCNTPIVKPNHTFLTIDDVAQPSVPSWDVVFSCDVADETKRRLAKFNIETPEGVSENGIKQKISAILRQQLG